MINELKKAVGSASTRETKMPRSISIMCAQAWASDVVSNIFRWAG